MTGRATTEAALLELAQCAGLAPSWQDAYGHPQQVEPDVLRALLSAMSLPAGSIPQIRESLHRLQIAKDTPANEMVISEINKPIVVGGRGAATHGTHGPGATAGSSAESRPTERRPTAGGPTKRGPTAGGPPFRIVLENGEEYSGIAQTTDAGGICIPGIARAGYHMLFVDDSQTSLAIAPSRCPSVAQVVNHPDPRLWGVAAQIYSLRHPDGGHGTHAAGFGDFSALTALARTAGRQGASALAISPVHAMFSAVPQRYSPYAPSSRLFLNALYADPAICLGEPAVGAALNALMLHDDAIRLDKQTTIDWPAAANLRMQVFRQLFSGFSTQAPEPQRNAFTMFRHEGGEALESHARFEALHAHYLPSLGPDSGWGDWPANMRDPASPNVKAYARQHKSEVAFHVFLQWLAAQGMQYAQRSARQAGMPVGLIADLAVGTDPRGSHAWSRQAEILTGLSAGAAPDIYNPFGQNWRLTAFSPHALLENGYGAYIEMLRATLAYAGGIRIDHVLGLARMWLVPDGAAAKEGAYLRYPQEDMLRLIALEASRHHAIVIGENLGTVPPGFDERLEQAGLSGISVLWFEREGTPSPTQAQPFLPSSKWSPHDIATTTTHDLPTVSGWWKKRDLDWRSRMGLASVQEAAALVDTQRDQDKSALWKALRDAGCVSPATQMTSAPPVEAPIEATLQFVAQSPAPLMLAPLEDLLGLDEQPNLPGTIDTHPNWIQRLPVDAKTIFERQDVQHRIAAIERGRRLL